MDGALGFVTGLNSMTRAFVDSKKVNVIVHGDDSVCYHCYAPRLLCRDCKEPYIKFGMNGYRVLVRVNKPVWLPEGASISLRAVGYQVEEV